MRVLVLSPVDLRNAAHNRLHDFVDYLSRRHTIDVVSTYAWWLQRDRPNGCQDIHRRDLPEASSGRVHIEYLGPYGENPIMQELFSFARARGILDRFKGGEYDLIFNYNTILSGALISRKLEDVPMIYDLADDIARMAADSPMVMPPLRFAVEPLSRLAISHSVRRSRHVTVATSELVATYRIPQGKTTVIPNGVDPDFFRPYDRNESKKRFNLEGKTVIGYVGVLREWVDFEMILSVLPSLRDKFPNLRMLVVGAEGRFQEFRELSKEMKVDDTVITTGILPYDEIPRVMSAMDIGIIPFRLNNVTRNALPLKLFEYMACGVPVISQRLKPVADAVDGNVLYASDSTEMLDCISKILECDSLRGEMSEEGMRTVRSLWSWQRIVPRLESVMREAAGVSE